MRWSSRPWVHYQAGELEPSALWLGRKSDLLTLIFEDPNPAQGLLERPLYLWERRNGPTWKGFYVERRRGHWGGSWGALVIGGRERAREAEMEREWQETCMQKRETGLSRSEGVKIKCRLRDQETDWRTTAERHREMDWLIETEERKSGHQQPWSHPPLFSFGCEFQKAALSLKNAKRTAFHHHTKALPRLSCTGIIRQGIII